VAETDPGLYRGPAQQAERDPWVHRSEGMSCRTCMFYVRKAAHPAAGGLKPPVELGRCRRHAPTMSGFPAVFPTDWCGDHKLDENRT
jgi:hypothetical protein